MRLAVRLWLLGAVVPVLAMVAALVVGQRFFRAHLMEEVDAALVSQAAVESVSLFDGPAGAAHIHVALSPLRDEVRHIAPAAALYDGEGRVVMNYPAGERNRATDERLDPETLPRTPVLATRIGPGGVAYRVLSVQIEHPSGEPYALQLAAALSGVDAAVNAFARVGLGMALATGLGLVLLQTILARRLASRVNALTRHMTALREGNLSSLPPQEQAGDEIAELSRVVGEATEKLRLAREAQDRLVADAAHELRTPLTLMRTSIDLALRRRREASELVASLEETRREVDRLARLSTRLLDLATAGRGQWDRQPGDLVQVAGEAAEAIRAEAEAKGIIVEVEAPAPVLAQLDAHGVRQAVDNLLANAVKFSPRGGHVTVSVRREGELARVVVKDAGPGIPESERERVFRPFERGDKRAPGAGLGLAIVREIARGHGGRAYAAPAEQGAKVVLELPALPVVTKGAKAAAG